MQASKSLRHRRVIRTTNLLERLFLEERRRTKIIPHVFGERPVLKLMYAAVIRAADRWRGIIVRRIRATTTARDSRGAKPGSRGAHGASGRASDASDRAGRADMTERRVETQSLEVRESMTVAGAGSILLDSAHSGESYREVCDGREASRWVAPAVRSRRRAALDDCGDSAPGFRGHNVADHQGRALGDGTSRA